MCHYFCFFRIIFFNYLPILRLNIDINSILSQQFACYIHLYFLISYDGQRTRVFTISLGFIWQTVSTFISSFNESVKDNEKGSQNEPELFQKDQSTRYKTSKFIIYQFSTHVMQKQK